MARLPPKVALAVMSYVDHRLAENPQRLSNPLAGELAHLRSARNGDYRVLFRVAEDPAVLWVMHIEHRAHVYRRR